MCFGSKASRSADAARDAETMRQNRIQQGQVQINDALKGFNDEFFAGREKAYLDFAAPQINDQFKDARKGLIFALSRSGLSQSGEAIDRTAKLTKDRDKAMLGAADQARATATEARKGVERTRGELYQQLFASADPAAAGVSAAQSAAALEADPSFSPIGQVFQNAAAGIGAYSAGRERERINDILAGAISPATGRSSSVRNVV